MMDVPEIAPEIRGLLEEIVADRRSSLRLVPRRALRTWFATGEMASAREISGTRAERHLIEEYRESLADLLRVASWIAYWKAPTMARRPCGPDGRPYDPSSSEPSWRAQAARSFTRPEGDAADLLKQCLTGVRASSAHALSLASLALVPSDRTRCYVALTIPWDRPLSAVRLFSELAHTLEAKAPWPDVQLALASRLCAAGRLSDARDSYRNACRSQQAMWHAMASAFNLSCFLGDVQAAREEARELDRIPEPHPDSVAECRTLLHDWRLQRSAVERGRALDVSRQATRSTSGFSATIFEVES